MTMSDEQITEAAEAPEPQPVEAPADTTSWRDGLPDDLKMDASLLKFNDVGSLAKSYVNAQRMIGADKIALPNEHATPEEWGEVYNRLGRPDAPDGYELSYGEGDEGQNVVGAYSSVAHELGLNQNQAEGLLNWYVGQEGEGQKIAEQSAAVATEEGHAELKSEWGRAFEQKAEAAHRAANALLGSTEIFDSVQLADGRKLGDHPAIVKMFATLSEQMSEDTLEGASTETAFTPDEAMRRIAEITAPNTPYWDKRHPQHTQYVEDALRFREYAHPE